MKATLSPLLGALTPVEAGKRLIDREMKDADILNESGMYEGATLLLIEMFGGKCPYCGAPWRKVSVDNPFVRFDYYYPICNCYVHCWHCSHIHIQEKALHREVIECSVCGIPLGWLHQGTAPLCPHTEPIDAWEARREKL